MAVRHVSATQLFAIARGKGVRQGNARCYYCGASCTEKRRASEYVKSSFTARSSVAGGAFVCDGCIAAMEERTEILLCDGSVRNKQRVRNYSWVITEGAAIAATKSHRYWLLSKCINPPEPPFVVCISDSGQRQLLYMARVNQNRDIVTVNLEDELVSYYVSELRQRVELCLQVASAIGRQAVCNRPDITSRMCVCDALGESVLSEWADVWGEPLTRLASWFLPNKKECEYVYRTSERQDWCAQLCQPIKRNRKDANSNTTRDQTTFGWVD